MIRRDTFIATGGFDEVLSNSQDTDMWFKLSAITDFVCVPKPQILYRILPISMSSNALGMQKSKLVILKRAFAHEKAKSYQHIKSKAIGNLYKFLCYTALKVPPGKQQNRVATKLLFTAIKTDLSLLVKPIIFKGIFKLITMAILPPTWVNVLFKKFPSLSNTSNFLGYIKT
jgi:hypothetical protein